MPRILALSRVLVSIRGFWLVNRFTDHLHVVTTNNYNSIADLHTKSSQSISTSFYLVTALYNDNSFTTSSLYVSWYWILASVVRWLTLHGWTLIWTPVLTRSHYTESGRSSRKTRVTCQNECLLARYPALGMARTTQKTSLPLLEWVFIVPLPSIGHGADHIENTSSNIFAIVACAYFGRCLEMGLHVTVLKLDFRRERQREDWSSGNEISRHIRGHCLHATCRTLQYEALNWTFLTQKKLSKDKTIHRIDVCEWAHTGYQKNLRKKKQRGWS
jgi:hypothetical protein